MIEIDVGEVLELFAGLNGRQQKQVYRNALRRAANILVRETRSQLKGKLGRKANSRNWWNNRTISSGIKSRADKEGKAAKVHIPLRKWPYWKTRFRNSRRRLKN